MTKPIPGPKGLPFIGPLLDFQRDPLAFLLKIADTYGSIAQYRLLGLQVYQLNHPDHIREVLVEQADKFHKDRLGKKILSFSMGNGLLTNNGDSHRRQRKLVQPAFHSKRIEGYAHTMVDYTMRMIGEWRDGQTWDMHREMLHLTLYIVSKALYNADVYHQADGVGEAVERLNETGGQQFTMGFMPPAWLPIPQMIQAKKDVKTLDGLMMPIIAERRKSAEDKGDLLSMLLLAQHEEGGGMSDQQVRDEAVTLFAAGHETTANALSWTWYLLAQHPEIETKLHAELDSVLAGRTPTMDDLKQLPYTDWIVKETLRLYPPAWVLSGREPLEDITIDGYHIPKGSNIFIVPYVVHRDPQYYEEPERFFPERWDNDFEKSLPRYAYLPFGGGPRVCIGNSFASMEARLILATVAQHFRLKLVPGQKIKPEPLITLRPKGGVQVKLDARQRVEQHNLDSAVAIT